MQLLVSAGGERGKECGRRKKLRGKECGRRKKAESTAAALARMAGKWWPEANRSLKEHEEKKAKQTKHIA